MEELTLNARRFAVLRLLGRGKGGYSYLVTDGAGEYVLKQIHHEPCAYYRFGDKLDAELRDYERLHALALPMPELLEVDFAQERLLKEKRSLNLCRATRCRRSIWCRCAS